MAKHASNNQEIHNENNVTTAENGVKYKANAFLDKIKEDRVMPKKVADGPQNIFSLQGLTRPKLKITKDREAMMILLAAVLISLITIIIVAANTLGKDISNQGSVEESLQRNVGYQMPQVASFLGMSQGEVQEFLSENGYIYVELPKTDETSTSYDLFKIPTDCDAVWAADKLKEGYKKMGVVNAAKLLYGGWQLTADKDNTTYARVRYADFKSLDVNTAIDNAIAGQNFTDIYVTKDDVDELGNTYKEGSAKDGKKNISWRVSALPFSEVYDIGLPESTIFVGIRVEQK